METLALSQGPYELPDIQGSGKYKRQESQHSLDRREGQTSHRASMYTHAHPVHTGKVCRCGHVCAQRHRLLAPGPEAIGRGS